MIVSASTWLSNSQLSEREASLRAIGRLRREPYFWISMPLWWIRGWASLVWPFLSLELERERPRAVVDVLPVLFAIFVSLSFRMSCTWREAGMLTVWYHECLHSSCQ